MPFFNINKCFLVRNNSFDSLEKKVRKSEINRITHVSFLTLSIAVKPLIFGRVALLFRDLVNRYGTRDFITYNQ